MKIRKSPLPGQAQQRPACPAAEKSRIHKKHVHMSAVAPHKAHRAQSACGAILPLSCPWAAVRKPQILHARQINLPHGNMDLRHSRTGKKGVRGHHTTPPEIRQNSVICPDGAAQTKQRGLSQS